VDFERVVDIHSFRLQMAHDDVRGQMSLLKGNFHDVYFGPECQYLVRDLRPGVPYTFRVCCRVEGDTEWSAWSLPCVATTNYAAFCKFRPGDKFVSYFPECLDHLMYYRFFFQHW
jgi:hypothetical protein